jgi:hypothetical protein
MMALLLGADSRAKSAKRVAAIRALAALPDAVREALKLDGAMKALAAQLKDAQDLIFFGRGYNYSTALEAALKARELSQGAERRAGCECKGARAAASSWAQPPLNRRNQPHPTRHTNTRPTQTSDAGPR